MDTEHLSYQQRLQQYREQFTEAVAQNAHRDPQMRSRFNELRQTLDLNPLAVGELEQSIIQDHLSALADAGGLSEPVPRNTPQSPSDRPVVSAEERSPEPQDTPPPPSDRPVADQLPDPPGMQESRASQGEERSQPGSLPPEEDEEDFSIEPSDLRKDWVDRYKKAVWDATQRALPIRDEDRHHLESQRQELGLTLDEAVRFEAEVIEQVKQEEDDYQHRCQQYQDVVREVCAVEWPPGAYAEHYLKQRQQDLGIHDKDLSMLTDPIVSAAQADDHDDHDDHPPADVETPQDAEEVSPNPLEDELSVKVQRPSTAFSYEDDGQMKASPLTPSDPHINDFPEDYQALEVALAQKRWQDADRQTLVILLKLTQREDKKCLDASSIRELQFQDLCDIDHLWSANSQGKFGFLAQRSIYQSLVGNYKKLPQRSIAFAKEVGWWSKPLRVFKVYTWLDFDYTRAQPGHLPALWFWQLPFLESILAGGFGTGRGFCDTDPGTLSTFMARLGVHELPDDIAPPPP
ncbi:MAG: hypothetical protein EA367_14460 [Leptolyngbya sp. DLM2.Bin15]|nr:MAG: hypothetical protein EA367_14460 [Leptolyngbya sp. DLM2.Bin15]